MGLGIYPATDKTSEYNPTGCWTVDQLKQAFANKAYHAGKLRADLNNVMDDIVAIGTELSRRLENVKPVSSKVPESIDT